MSKFCPDPGGMIAVIEKAIATGVTDNERPRTMLSSRRGSSIDNSGFRVALKRKPVFEQRIDRAMLRHGDCPEIRMCVRGLQAERRFPGLLRD